MQTSWRTARLLAAALATAGCLLLSPAAAARADAAPAPVGDGVADDTAALQALLDRGGTVTLRPAATYRITHWLRFRVDDTALVTAAGPSATILLDRAAFASAARPFAPGNVGLRIEGLQRPVLKNLRIALAPGTTTVRASAAALEDVTEPQIENLEIAGFSSPYFALLSLTGVSGGIVDGLHIHDARSDDPALADQQITGIAIDRGVRGRASSGLLIRNPRIENLRFGGALRAAQGEQTDGITFHALPRTLVPPAVGVTVIGARIGGVGEGIDLQSHGHRILDSEFRDIVVYPLKFVHAATGNLVHGAHVANTGRSVVVFVGSNNEGGAPTGNTVRDVTATGVGSLDLADQPARVRDLPISVVATDGSSARHRPRANRVENLRATASPQLVDVIVDASGQDMQFVGVEADRFRGQRYRAGKAAAGAVLEPGAHRQR